MAGGEPLPVRYRPGVPDHVITVVGVVVAVVLALLALGVLFTRARGRSGRRHSRRPTRSASRPEGGEPPPPKRVAIVVNPTKFEDLDRVLDRLTAAATGLGWDPPLLLETTKEDPGPGQTARALAEGVDLVCALGGDGTVRNVAEVMAGSGVPMGLLPAGTGNLLARNLAGAAAVNVLARTMTVPVGSLEHALDVALTGRNKAIDVGWVLLDPGLPEGPDATHPDEDDEPVEDDEPAEEAEPAGAGTADEYEPTEDHEATEGHETAGGREPVETGLAPTAAARRAGGGHAFVVMAGMGFDAAIMGSTTEQHKARMGWGAYVASGLRNLRGARFRTRLVIDDGEETRHRARTVIAGNCGRITGGITLMPDARIDDGVLDVVALTPKGLAGWAGVAAHVIAKNDDSHLRLDRYRGRRVLVMVDEPQRVQVDGDVIGEASRVLMEIDPGSLVVRVGSHDTGAEEQTAPDHRA